MTDSTLPAQGAMGRYHQVLRRRMLMIAVLVLAIIASLVLDFTLGPAGLSLPTLWQSLLHPTTVDAGTRVIVWDIRLPYALMAVVVGFCLGLAGAEMQTILNNPLASPFTLGVSSAAAFGAALAIILGIGIPGVPDQWLISANAFVFALFAALMLDGVTRWTRVSTSGVVLFGIALVLSAVLLPMAFFAGSTGVIYRQFSITIVSAMALSVLMALIFTPALCATILKRASAEHKTTGLAGWFNRHFDSGTLYYTRGVSTVISRRGLFIVVYLVIVGVTGFLFTRVPTTFLPEEDQGVMMLQVTLPVNASAQRTQLVLNDINDYLQKNEASVFSSMFGVNGFSFAGRGQNSGMVFVRTKDWSERKQSSQSVQALAARISAHFASYPNAKVFAMVPPAVMELGNATGFDFYLQDTAGHSHQQMMDATHQFLQLANQDPRLTQVRMNSLEDEPMYQLEINDERASALGLSMSDVNNTLSVAWGSSYIDQFMYNGRVKQVYLMGKAASRVTPEDLNKWYFRNSSGTMVPFSAFGSGKWVSGSPHYERFNGMTAEEIQGSPAPGYSSGEAMKAVEEIAAKLPKGFRVQWYGISYEEQTSGSQTTQLYALSILVVFLCLAALYESWSIPFSVILVVPLGILGTLCAVLLRGLQNDVFFQVGLLTTVGLAAKNAILIVEFAKELHERDGKSLVEAALEAARLRIRPIIMTSMAFILGVLPLTISSGAGAGSQHSIGTAVVGGMITATFLAIFFVPMFYVVVAQFFSRKKENAAPEEVNHDR